MKKQLLIIPFLLAGFFTSAQVNDPCKGDIIGKKAGSSPYTIPKNCDVVIMGISTYDSLKLTELKLRAEILLLDQNVAANKDIIRLKDSVAKELRGIITDQDRAIADYRRIATESQQLAEDCTKNTDKCIKELKVQKFKKVLFTIVGTAAGLLTGFVIGIFAQDKP